MKSEAFQITPKTHLLYSIVNADGWSVNKAISEFVDNAFAVNAGNADAIFITFSDSFISIDDNGQGLKHISALFTLGESGSYGHRSDIGMYGMGAKESSVWLGHRLLVETRRDGVRHVAKIDWQQLFAAGPDAEWPKLEPDVNKVSSDVTGTRIRIEGIRKGRNITRLETLAAYLGETYAIAIQSGKVIRLKRAHKGQIETMDVEPFYPRGWSDIIKIRGSVEGKKYTAEVGILSEVVSNHSGIRFCYGHRVVEKKTKLVGDAIPARIFGYVMLDTSWKDHLSKNKTEIIDAEELERDVASRLEDLFKMARKYEEDLIIEGLNVHLSDILTKSWRESVEGVEYGKRREPENPGTRTRKHPSPPMTPVPDGDVPVQEEMELERRGLNMKINKLGADGVMGMVEESDSGLTVILNEDSPLMGRALRDQTTAGKSRIAAYATIVGQLVAKHAHEQGPRWARRIFVNAGISEEKERVWDSVLIWWSNVATRPIWEGEK